MQTILFKMKYINTERERSIYSFACSWTMNNDTNITLLNLLQTIIHTLYIVGVCVCVHLKNSRHLQICRPISTWTVCKFFLSFSLLSLSSFRSTLLYFVWVYKCIRNGVGLLLYKNIALLWHATWPDTYIWMWAEAVGYNLHNVLYLCNWKFEYGESV